MNKPRILCYLNHYYNANGVFNGKSSSHDSNIRKEIVQKTLEGLNLLENATVMVCGIEGSSLVDLDITFNYLEDSRMLIFASLVEMTKHVDEYDYFLNVEDDILVPNEVLNNIYEFDQVSSLNEVLLPNRLEQEGTEVYCVDTKICFPGWINTERIFKNKLIKVAINPHSGILILSKAKLLHAISSIDLTTISKSIGGPMAASYAHFHKPFCLYRFKDDIKFHSIIHMDKWAPRKKSNLNLFKISSLKRFLKVLPLRLKFHIEDIL
ncbi:MAG TPA: hypothetical protein VFC65_03405 [Prolixibacteraceae bacterium]|nr:hypothetical protein [Prolixibacteraceae bacterium]